MWKIFTNIATYTLLTSSVFASTPYEEATVGESRKKRDAVEINRPEDGNPEPLKRDISRNEATRWKGLGAILNGIATDVMGHEKQFFTNVLKARAISQKTKNTQARSFATTIEKTGFCLSLLILAQPSDSSILVASLQRLRIICRNLLNIQSEDIIKEASLCPMIVALEYKLLLLNRPDQLDTDLLDIIGPKLAAYSLKLKSSNPCDEEQKKIIELALYRHNQIVLRVFECYPEIMQKWISGLASRLLSDASQK